MKAIVVMFDSLNRKWLEPYGSTEGVPTPNFARLAQHSATMRNSYVCSMPCMPARRDLLTGRPGFLHRGWGPMEPFDDAFPEMLREQAGVHSHLVTDHYHYFEEGGQNYHTKFSTWDFQRGQEGDPWKPRLDDGFAMPEIANRHSAERNRQDMVNREQPHSQIRTFDSGLEFIEHHHGTDNWYLQIETFDPHEPFFATEEWRQQYSPDYTGPVTDWPAYGALSGMGDDADRLPQWRKEYAALVAMCDHSLGRVLDAMDAHDLWKDTMLIVGTDHGFFLGEQGYVGKGGVPLWDEMCRTPLFIWDPQSGVKGEQRDSLAQIIDWGPTLLDFFGCESAPDMTGHSLRQAVADDTPMREAALFGYTNHYLNVTDGRYVYMRANDPDYTGKLWDYTLDPAHMAKRYSLDKLQSAEPVGALSYSKGVPVMRYEATALREITDPQGTLLYDLQNDPGQKAPLDDTEVESRMTDHARSLMAEIDAPPEQYARVGWSLN